MGKRSNFERLPRDSYDTPYSAVIPLMRHLPRNTEFIEPCAGKNALVNHLELHGHKCISTSDIEPRAERIKMRDLFDGPFEGSDLIITNPPWDRKILHALIEKIVDEKRAAWLLFDADWCHTKQSAQYMPYVGKIVSIGRVKWIEGSKYTGKENCAWYYIDHEITETTFYGRLWMPT